MVDYIIKEYCDCQMGMREQGPWPSARLLECQDCDGRGVHIYEDWGHDMGDIASNYPKAFLIQEVEK